jgi:hypothetical protein
MKPKEINLGINIDESKIKDLNLPIREILLAEIINNADICYLEKEGTDDWNLRISTMGTVLCGIQNSAFSKYVILFFKD